MSDTQPDAGPATGPQMPAGDAPQPRPVPEFDLSTMARSPLIDAMGIAVVSASPETLVGTMPVEGNTQPYGLLHGGASCVLAESLGSVGAAMHAAQLHGGIAVGVDINATHHKGVRDGIVTGVATPIRLGATIASYEIVITDEVGERVCTARLTCAILRASR
jgi:1,4-dihydroxy-2-naphthoyl-CoA hydrolase